MRFLLVLLWVLGSVGAHAQGVLPVPTLTARVIDQTGTLDAIERQGLEDKLAALEKDKGAQVAFLIVATTQPEDIASYANRVANAWKIGRKGVGDGLLLVVAKEDRKIRIEVAKTLEGAIPDLRARQIIDEAITPAFRANDYAGGLRATADRITALVAGEALPAPASPREGAGRSGLLSGFDWVDTAIFLFLAVPVGGAMLRGIFGRKIGALLTSAGVGTIALLVTTSLVVAAIAAFAALLFVLLSSGTSRGGAPWIGSSGTGGGWGSGGGGWSSGGGGGGFSSGGGGDFGGGGASGDW